MRFSLWCRHGRSVVVGAVIAIGPTLLTPPLFAAEEPAKPPAVAAPPGPSSTATPTSPSTPLRALSLDEALRYARDHQPTLKVASARVQEAQARAEIPTGQWFPQIGALAEVLGGTSNNSTSSYLGDRALDIPRIGGSPAGTTGTFKPYASTFVGLGLRQQVFDFGRIAAQRAALDHVVELERARADLDRLELDLAVRQAYYAVLGAKAVVAAADAAYVRAKTHRDFAKAGVDNKLRAPVELARTEADLARFEVGRVRAKGNLTYAQTIFAAIVGAPESALDVTATAPEPAEPPTLDAALDAAGKKDPLLRAAIAELRAQEAHTTAIGAEMRPSLYLSATVSGRAGGAPLSNSDTPTGSGILPVIPNWDVTLVLSWPLFDGVVSRRADASRAAEATIRTSLDARRFEQIATIRRAYVALTLAKSSIPALERALDAAKINQSQTEARFSGGLATSVELADAESLLTDAEIALVVGRFELARARAVLGRAIAEGL